MKKREVEIKPVYQPCWISYLGAASGILRSLGKNHDIVDVGGYSGWGFLVNVSKGDLCPSGPTAHRAYSDIFEGTQSLGFKLKGYSDNGTYPSKEGELSEEEAKEAEAKTPETKKAAPKKAVAQKAEPEKKVTRKTAAKKTVAKKPAGKTAKPKEAAKKVETKRAAPKKTETKKTTAKKSETKKAEDKKEDKA